jgi:hypothetical protein
MLARLFPKDYNFLRSAYWLGQIDSRPLSVFRIFFAALLLKDALYHIPLARWFYSDEGLLPRSVLLEVARGYRFSLMDAVANEWMAVAFFVLWGGVTACLMLGYRTKLMTLLNFICILSIHERNVYILTSADTVIRVLSFWAMFVPLGHYYSIDARRAAAAPSEAPTTAFALPVRLVQLQVALVYLTTGILKSGDIWWRGEAIHYALQLQSITLPTGDWLLAYGPDWLLHLITYQTLVTEMAFVFLVFAPVAQPALRAIGLTLGALLHIGIGLAMAIPDFSIVMMISYLIFFEPTWIVWLQKRLGGRRQVTESPQPTPDPLPVGSNARSLVIQVGVSIVALTCMVGVVWWNRNTLTLTGKYSAYPMPDWADAFMEYTGLWQGWAMFAPYPSLVDGWIEIPGKFEDGTIFDLRTGAAPVDDMPQLYWGPDMRWKKYEENINRDRNVKLLEAWASYYCNQYNTVESLPMGQRLATLEIHIRFRHSYAPGKTAAPYQDELLWKHWCYDEYQY